MAKRRRVSHGVSRSGLLQLELDSRVLAHGAAVGSVRTRVVIRNRLRFTLRYFQGRLAYT